jgi:hypothetical protein
MTTMATPTMKRAHAAAADAGTATRKHPAKAILATAQDLPRIEVRCRAAAAAADVAKVPDPTARRRHRRRASRRHRSFH